MVSRKSAVRPLPRIETLFPDHNRQTLVRFWIKYWLWFFALLPWMLFRQIGISLLQCAGALWTWNRDVRFLDGALHLIFMNNLPSLVLTTIFGERFTAIRYQDALIDPGPPFGRAQLARYLQRQAPTLGAIAATHAHEEHIGNAALAAAITGAPVYGTAVTLEALRHPEVLSLPRRLFIGQPEPADAAQTRLLPAVLTTPSLCLEAIPSPGHCDGHASLFDRARGILFAGDSFLHTVFTAPNRDVSGAEWIRTLEAYCQLDIRTMVGAHGHVYSVDDAIRPRWFVTRRADPKQMIRDKLMFMRWAQNVVWEGERRGLPYSVIEACLFPWQHWWSWHTWFTDESGRLFSAGEFSRTYFVRSLSRTPDRVPARFPPFARFASWVTGAGRSGS
jgi:hydroxyacylglutathione hydrolase